MKIEVTQTSVSKKGTVWLTVKLVSGEVPMTGQLLTCEPADKKEDKKKEQEDEANDN